MLSTNAQDIEALSVVVPVYNNAQTLVTLISRLREALEPLRLPFEFIFVVDASPDDSLKVLKRTAEVDKAVKILALERNLGQNWAILIGLANASGDAIATLDADLQDPPEAIPTLVQTLGKGADVVFGGRRGDYESRPRLLGSRIFKRLVHLLSGTEIPHDAGLFLVMKKVMAKHLLTYRIHDPYVIALMSRTEFCLKSIPVRRSLSPDSGSSYTTRTRFVLAWKALATLFRVRQSAFGDRQTTISARISRDFEPLLIKYNF